MKPKGTRPFPPIEDTTPTQSGLPRVVWELDAIGSWGSQVLFLPGTRRHFTGKALSSNKGKDEQAEYSTHTISLMELLNDYQ